MGQYHLTLEMLAYRCAAASTSDLYFLAVIPDITEVPRPHHSGWGPPKQTSHAAAPVLDIHTPAAESVRLPRERTECSVVAGLFHPE